MMICTGANKCDWVIDSGASRHMCNDRSMFVELGQATEKVTLGDSS